MTLTVKQRIQMSDARRRSVGASEAMVLAEIRRVAREELDLDREIGTDDHLVRDLQLDSLALATLAASVESRFGVALEEHDAAEVTTVGALIRLVVRRIDEVER